MGFKPSLLLALLAASTASGIFFFSKPPMPDIVLPQPPKQNHYEQAQANTVLLVVGDAQGSGVVIVRGEKVFIWTAAHVVEGATDAKVKVFIRDNQFRRVGETIFSAVVVARDTKLDIALLWSSAPSRFFTGALFDTSPSHVGDAIFIVGNFYGADMDGAVTTGIISQVGLPANFGPGGIWTIADQMSAAIAPGASGGPVFRESSNRIIGLNVGSAPNAFIFVPVRALYQFATKEGLTWAILDSSFSETEDNLVHRAFDID